jgi:25S rRNA (adenine2142-N1)-methyltransferase
MFDVTRIDLHAQDPNILQQDFMERPLPTSDEERFDIVSLSLVVNFVPEAAARGEMLRRTVQFLRTSLGDGETDRLFPSLFLVLPLSCLTNARYMNEARLAEIMQSLGYTRLKRKLSSKLAYYLWGLQTQSSKRSTFKKVEVNPGRTRNNFAIVMT